ncbi:hypothetical protein GALMADRAFT_211755 [Galerina marginata CBS 339.88]|uniref:Transmembrane protein 188 n=1 Tax=Galerina marginata (strain CBS 339.88) TaxID=685588 RepID=A0A067SVB6_GALM3|nr:hypothetical protein GALMADRAFT_211755 [Galerina marginata CBS 339.88]
MAPRPNMASKGSFGPLNDSATYRDLLLFEERLKTNAANLQRRKSRYQPFLLCEVILPPQISLLSIPYKMALQRLLPDIYTPDTQVMLHPYFASGLLFVSVTTLVLFFASGMYSEKIAYANKYVPHANRALRSFNMFLNVRKPPLRSKFYWNPLSFFFPRPDEPTSSSAVSTTSSRSPTPTTRNRPRSSSTSRPMHTIPPSTNPRGELIFSSRVDKIFREAYERYRSAFERRREEKEYNERRKTWWGKLMFWERPPTPASAGGAAPPPPSRAASNASSRGRASRSGTPPTTPGSSSSAGGGGGIVMRQRDRSDSPLRRVSPPKLRRDRDSMGETDMRTAVLERTVFVGNSP